jgi:hypothetical protein
VARPAAGLVGHAREGRPTKMPEGLGGGHRPLRRLAAGRRGGGAPRAHRHGGPAHALAPEPRRRPAGRLSGGRGAPAGLVGALGCAGARTRRRNACGCLAPGALSWSAAARGMVREDVPACPCVLGLPELRLGPRDPGPPGFQRRADATEHAGLELSHQLADILHLPCPRPVCAHPLRRDHSLVQGLRQIEPGQLPAFSANNLHAHARATGRKSSPGAALRAGGGG